MGGYHATFYVCTVSLEPFFGVALGQPKPDDYIVEFIEIPESSSVEILVINKNNHVAGNYIDDITGEKLGFFWKDGSLELFDFEVRLMNDKDQIVGTGPSFPANGFSNTTFTLWENGIAKLISDDDPNDAFISPQDINNKGQIVGYRDFPRAFIYDIKTGVFTNLTVEGVASNRIPLTEVFALQISDHGYVTGFAQGSFGPGKVFIAIPVKGNRVAPSP